MGLKKLAAKVAEYNDRLDNGKASRIKASHVEAVLEKLRRKSTELEEKVSSTESAEKKERLRRKLRIAQAHVERAEWLLEQLD